MKCMHCECEIETGSRCDRCAARHREILATLSTVRIIKGHPGGPNGKWEEVQAIQHEPFIFVQYNGSHFAGTEPDDVTVLLDMLAKHKLRSDFAGAECYSFDPCSGIRNPEWTVGSNVPHFIDGERLYACDGVVRFSGNFERYSHAFGIDTNHKPTIDALLAAIEANSRL